MMPVKLPPTLNCFCSSLATTLSIGISSVIFGVSDKLLKALLIPSVLSVSLDIYVISLGFFGKSPIKSSLPSSNCCPT